MSFPNYRQLDNMDCGPTCLRIIAKHFGKKYKLNKLRDLSETTRAGSSLHGISEAAETIGFHSLGAKIDFKLLCREAPLPCIVHWKQNHFIVVYKIDQSKVYVSDPQNGLLRIPIPEFLNNWIGPGAEEDTREGVVPR